MAKFDDARIAAIIEGRRAIKKVTFPPLDCVLGVRALSEADSDAARLEASRYCKNVKGDLNVDPEFFDREVRRQMIWRSFFDPDSDPKDPVPFWESDKEVRKLDSALIVQLFNVYFEVQEEIVPNLTLTDEEASALVSALGKAGEPEAALRLYEPPTLRLFVRSLASRLHAMSPPGKSSTTQP